MTWRLITLIDCPGCGAAPVLETEFGRHLYVCPNYAGRTTGATGRCVKHMATPTAYDLEDAGEYWNLSCQEMVRELKGKMTGGEP